MDNVSTREERYQAANGTIASHQDSYLYDDLDRLISVDHVSATNEGSFSRSYQYDSRGNILYKSDAGRMTYAGNNRIKQELSTDGKNETTYYLGKSYEYVIHNEGFGDQYIQMKHHLYAGDEVVAIQVRTLHNGEKQPDVTRYLHKDALGNIDTITDAHGVIVQRAEYDAFGKRTVTQGKLHEPWTNRGYTGHEHLTDFGLIHMNARIYDPIVGRFLSADTYIQAPDISQSHNRYAYVMNNPLKYTDPSGHFWFLAAILFVAVAAVTDIPILDTIAQIVVGIALNIAFPGAVFMTSFMKGAAAGFIGGLVSGGGLKGALRGAFFGGLAAGVASAVGHGFNGVGGSPFGEGLGKHLMHGITQGAISELRGGSFKSGFIGAVAGSVTGMVTKGISKVTATGIAIRMSISGVFGGLAAKASGGSFQDGALHAAMVHLFNDLEGGVLQKMRKWANRSWIGRGLQAIGVMSGLAGPPQGPIDLKQPTQIESPSRQQPANSKGGGVRRADLKTSQGAMRVQEVTQKPVTPKRFQLPRPPGLLGQLSLMNIRRSLQPFVCVTCNVVYGNNYTLENQYKKEVY